MSKERTFTIFDLNDPNKDICLKLNDCNDESAIISELTDILSDVNENETFSSMVLYYLRSKHLSSRDMYERAFIDRRLIHKIIRNPKYHPSKKTVFALCIAFELNYFESLELLGLASYSFATNSRNDMILKYFFMKGIYDIDLINSVLYHFRCPCIGE